MWRRRAGALLAIGAWVTTASGCAQVGNAGVDPPPPTGTVPAQTAATGPAEPAEAATTSLSVTVPPAPATSAASILAASPVVARLTRQGGAPLVRTSRWTPGNGPAAEGIAIQLVYRKGVRLVGVVPLVTPTGAASYRVEKMRVDATARRFLVYVDARSGSPKVVGITAGE